MSAYVAKTLLMFLLSGLVGLTIWSLILGARRGLRALWWVTYRSRMKALGAWLDRFEHYGPEIWTRGRNLVAVEVADTDANLSLPDFLDKYGVTEREFCTTYGH
ncbi:hypothetical protein DLP3_103 [Stenotrophomonas phage vB_SmaS_DLP_3]|nr:hypothetical protein DLP3_103 [Stenotrophomonas phage vB_SmaS_DLP_3]